MLLNALPQFARTLSYKSFPKKTKFFHKSFPWNGNIFLQYFKGPVKPAEDSVKLSFFLHANILTGPVHKGQAVEASWKLEELASLIKEERLAIVRVNFRGLEVRDHTDKKEKEIFLLYKGNSEWSSCKVIYEEGLPNI